MVIDDGVANALNESKLCNTHNIDDLQNCIWKAALTEILESRPGTFISSCSTFHKVRGLRPASRG